MRIKKAKRLLASAVLVFSTAGMLFGCSGGGGQKENQELLTKEVFAMDTYMSISAYGEEAEEALAEAEEEILRLDALLAAQKEDSEIAAVNKNGGGAISEDSAYLIERARQIHADTDGAFEIAIYPIKQAWGFNDQEYRVPEESELQELLPLADTDAITVDEETSEVSFAKEGMMIDLGGIAKGYTADRIAEIYRNHGVSGLINLGGNVQAQGKKNDGSNWRIAVRKPESTEDTGIDWVNPEGSGAKALKNQDYLGVCEISDLAVVTSGGYERYFEEDGVVYHHIIDPQTGKPSDSGLASATIVSTDGTLADGLSTSVFVMGLDKATQFWRTHSDDFDMILLDTDGNLYATEGLKEIFSSELDIEWID